MLSVLRSELEMLVIANEVVVAFVVVALIAIKPPLKVLSAEKMFVVVVLNAVVNAPVDELYASGYEAESDDDEILLLKTL